MGFFGDRLPIRLSSRLLIVFSLTLPGILLAKRNDASAPNTRDPRQLSVLVADFDGTVGHNVGNYRLRRVFNPEVVSSFFTSISGLPEEILVPVADFEGNTGPRIGLRIGKVDERQHFIPSTSLDPIELSNGQVIIPGLYYLDPQSSYREFREPQGEEASYLVTDVKKKLKKQTPFLLDAYAFISAAMTKKFKDRARAAILTMRGHSSAEMHQAFNGIQKELGQEANDWPLEAFVNLTHPGFYEFSASKAKYLRHLYDELGERVIQDSSTPHFLVMFENDRNHLKAVDDLFMQLSNRGVFSNPVVPILVNLVEPEVFANPDGIDWDAPPMQQLTKMSRVTVYWPGRVERTNNLARVFELALSLSPEAAAKTLAGFGQNDLMCSHALLVAGGGK